MERTKSKKATKGNPYRCKICGNLASVDEYCTPCRQKVEADEDYPLDRKVFFDHTGRDSTPFSKDGFKIIKKDYGITRKRW
jgi:hypothetical protein